VLGHLITNISSAGLDKIFIKIDVKYLCQITQIQHFVRPQVKELNGIGAQK
jgi:hypothetical protein